MQKGFSLIELSIVIIQLFVAMAIIGLLVSMMLVFLKGVREKESQDKQSCYTIKTECSNSCLADYEKCNK